MHINFTYCSLNVIKVTFISYMTMVFWNNFFINTNFRHLLKIIICLTFRTQTNLKTGDYEN